MPPKRKKPDCPRKKNLRQHSGPAFLQRPPPREFRLADGSVAEYRPNWDQIEGEREDEEEENGISDGIHPEDDSFYDDPPVVQPVGSLSTTYNEAVEIGGSFPEIFIRKNGTSLDNHSTSEKPSSSEDQSSHSDNLNTSEKPTLDNQSSPSIPFDQSFSEVKVKNNRIHGSPRTALERDIDRILVY